MNTSVEESLKLLERYGVTLVILAVIAFAIGVIAMAIYREWLHWRPKVEKWINDWTDSVEKTQETHRTVATSSLDLQRSNSITLRSVALQLKSVAERPNCPLADTGDFMEIIELRRQLRAQRKLSESRPQSTPPSSNGL